MRKLLLTLLLVPCLAWAGNPVENSYGILGSASGTVTVRTLSGTYNFNLPATAGTSGTPLISGGGGSTAMTWGTLTGNTTKFATSTGTLTSGHCLAVDASGNVVDSGAACLTGSTAPVTSVATRTGAITLTHNDLTDWSTATSSFLTSAPVTSVQSRTGAVTISLSDISGAAPLASPAFTGTPTAPTATTADNSTTLATTAFVKAQGYGTGSGAGTITGVTAGSGLAGGGTSGTVTVSLGTLTLNTVLGSVSSTTPSGIALPSCIDSSGNHLNYTTGTGFSCGTSTSGGGGQLPIYAPSSVSSGGGTAVSISGGSTSASSNTGGAISIVGGAGITSTSAAGGAANITGGASINAAGNVVISGGDTSSGGGASSGGVTIQSGAATNSASTGNILIQTKIATSNSSTAGNITMTAGNAPAAGTPGSVSITAGSNTTTSGFAYNGAGSNITLTSGAGGYQNSNGGDLKLTTGLGAGTGRRGLVIITTLPTSDPHVVGALWSNSGVLTVSAG